MPKDFIEKVGGSEAVEAPTTEASAPEIEEIIEEPVKQLEIEPVE